ncbi:MAG: hypothetical protein HQK84_11855 [Nitrospinae bacterium]|nr:hypothetical protein [Nitrospinota bacterium]
MKQNSKIFSWFLLFFVLLQAPAWADSIDDINRGLCMENKDHWWVTGENFANMSSSSFLISGESVYYFGQRNQSDDQYLCMRWNCKTQVCEKKIFDFNVLRPTWKSNGSWTTHDKSGDCITWYDNNKAPINDRCKTIYKNKIPSKPHLP